MSTVYFTKYNNSKEANEYLSEENPKYRDWEVTTLFYSVLNLLAQYCASRSMHIPTSHQEREEVVSKYLSPIAIDYVSLYTLSKNARYESLIKHQELETGKAYFSTIENYLLSMI